MTRRASSEGAQEPSTSEAGSTTATTTTPHPQPPAPLPSLPSGNVSHSTTYFNETRTRLLGFQSGIASINAEIEGQQAAHEKVLTEMEQKHAEAKGDLLRRLRDMQDGEAMAAAALDVWMQQHPEHGAEQ